jgi:LysR family transcriptional regulator, glycine cleavage system transcriptional activator
VASRLPPLNPLRAFEATARRGSVTAAARELNVTHSAVSHQIKALEAHLGIVLFERIGRRLKLTGQGAKFLPVISNAFGEIAAATAGIARPTTQGDLTISCVPALLTFWLLQRLVEFTSQFPDVRLTLIPTNDPTEIYGSRVDVSILYGDGSWSDCWVKHWTGLQLFPVIGPTLMNNRPLRTVRDIGKHAILHADEGREWHAWLSAVDGLDLLRTRHHFMSDARLAIDAAVRGAGIAIGDSMTVSGMLSRGDLVVPFDRSVTAVHSFYVACRSEMRSAPIVRVFIDWLYAALEAADARAEPQQSARAALRKRKEQTDTVQILK